MTILTQIVPFADPNACVLDFGRCGSIEIGGWGNELKILATDLLDAIEDRDLATSIVRAMIDIAHAQGVYRDVAGQLTGLDVTWGDLVTNARLEPVRLEAGRINRALPQNPIAHPNAIHGTPITPRAQLQKMKGASFCVSYFAPDQLEDCISLLGPDSQCLLDNGTYSAWRQGFTLDTEYWEGYWSWALPLLDRVEQAVAVIPDVIDGDPHQNMAQIVDALDRVHEPLHRLMPVWHLHEPIAQLEQIVEMGFRWVAFGSSGDFAVVGTPSWDARVDEAFQAIERVCEAFDELHPRVHMMRGLGQLPRGRHPFSSADSTNVARNHARQTKAGEPIERFRGRIEAQRFPVPDRSLWPHAERDPDAAQAQGIQARLFA